MSAIEKHICRNCGREFLTRDVGMKFCNLACKQEYGEVMEERYRARPCLHCNKAFKPRYVHQKYCCPECYNEHQKVYRQIALNKIRSKHE